jgi:hypothetical protein
LKSDRTKQLTKTTVIPYDDPAHLERMYADWERDDDGYPFIWPKISALRRAEENYRCEDCGLAYRAEGDRLEVHHFNRYKADCRRRNLDVYCGLHHSQDHEPSDPAIRDIYCRKCKGWFGGVARYLRHVRGMHPVEDRKREKSKIEDTPAGG